MRRVVVRWIGALALGAMVAAGSSQGNLLEGLTRPAPYRAARVSSYDRTGGNADALSGVQPGETAVLADLEGPGMITHIWITIGAERWHGRKIVLRMFWDGEDDPSVLVPLNDFFCMGHGLEAPMWSVPITTTADGRARNCFFQMPFNRRARIEITNEGLEPIGAFYYYVDYRKYDKPFDDPLYFHARYRQEYPARKGERYLICEARGRGHYVGTVFSVESCSDGWWGEGDDRFFIDGETTPSLHGTGSEDYLNDAWGTWKGSSPFYGCSIHEGQPYIYPNGTRYTSYRFHITDPIPFRESLRFDIEHYGAGVVDGQPHGFIERFDNVSSVAFWYQTEPHMPMEPLPPVDERLPAEAAEEKALLGFLRRAREPQNKDSIRALRGAYADLITSESQARHRPLLRVRMAAAELAAGHPGKAREILKDELEPFAHRSVVRELADAAAGLLGEGLTSASVLLVPWEDGSVLQTVKEGRKAVITSVSERKSHIYFALPEDSPLRGTEGDVVLRITWYSEEGRDNGFVVHYDSALQEDGMAGAYRESESLGRSTGPGWQTSEVRLPRALLAGRQNGRADFRISDTDGRDDIIGAIQVERPSPEAR